MATSEACGRARPTWREVRLQSMDDQADRAEREADACVRARTDADRQPPLEELADPSHPRRRARRRCRECQPEAPCLVHGLDLEG